MDLVPYVKSIFGLLIVIILILVASRFLKKFYNISFLQNAKDRRINIEDILYIDSKTKIVLVKRDEFRHLLIVGENYSSVIETIKVDEQV